MIAAALPVLASGLSAIGGASTLSLISAGVTAASGVIGGIYQMKVADNERKMHEARARDAQIVAMQEARDQDVRAKMEQGVLAAGQAASGLNVGSSSFALRRRAFSRAASVDRDRIIDAGNQRAQGELQLAENAKARGTAAKFSIATSLIGGALDAAGGIQQSQALVNDRAARRILGPDQFTDGAALSLGSASTGVLY